MRSISNPTDIGREIFLSCSDSVGIEPLRTNLLSVADMIGNSCSEYLSKAKNADLYLIPPCYSTNDALYLGVATKQNFKDVYSQQMVGANKPGRVIYDRLMSSAPGAKCPFCGFGHVKTLDHYLPKSTYPQFSVFPSNLIPACNDCNFSKRAGLPKTKGEQSIHPYFDSSLISEQWLFARLVHSTPVTVDYYVKAPAHWPEVNVDRVTKHLEVFDLRKRFAIEAADELANVRNILRRNFGVIGPAAVKAELLAQASDRYTLHRNSWQTAFFQALANDDWYCGGGYLHS